MKILSKFIYLKQKEEKKSFVENWRLARLKLSGVNNKQLPESWWESEIKSFKHYKHQWEQIWIFVRFFFFFFSDCRCTLSHVNLSWLRAGMVVAKNQARNQKKNAVTLFYLLFILVFRLFVCIFLFSMFFVSFFLGCAFSAAVQFKRVPIRDTYKFIENCEYLQTAER